MESQEKAKAEMTAIQKAERVAGYGMSGFLATQLPQAAPEHYLWLLGAIVLLVVLSGARELITEYLHIRYGVRS
jgi:hypothetical protein